MSKDREERTDIEADIDTGAQNTTIVTYKMLGLWQRGAITPDEKLAPHLMRALSSLDASVTLTESIGSDLAETDTIFGTLHQQTLKTINQLSYDRHYTIATALLDISEMKPLLSHELLLARIPVEYRGTAYPLVNSSWSASSGSTMRRISPHSHSPSSVNHSTDYITDLITAENQISACLDRLQARLGGVRYGHPTETESEIQKSLDRELFVLKESMDKTDNALMRLSAEGRLRPVISAESWMRFSDVGFRVSELWWAVKAGLSQMRAEPSVSACSRAASLV